MEADEEECARLIDEEETHIAEEMRLKSEKEEQARLKAEEETRLSEELRLKSEALGYQTCLGVGRLWRWEILGYCYCHTCTSCLSPLSVLPLSMQ